MPLFTQPIFDMELLADVDRFLSSFLRPPYVSFFGGFDTSPFWPMKGEYPSAGMMF